MGETLNLRKFDITWIKCTHTVVMLGRRNTGKSFVVRDLLYYHRDVPAGAVICPTEGVNPTYSRFIPSVFIHEEYNASIVDNLMARQRKLKLEIQEQEMQYGSCPYDPRVFLIMDDCGADADAWARTKQIKNLFMNGRHSNVLVLITMQYPMGIPPDIRGNIDFVFILRENVVANRKRIWDNYAGIFPTFEMFQDVLNQCTEDYEMLVIANGVNSNVITDCVFWYKAEAHPPFKMCSEQFWEIDARLKQEERAAAAAAKQRGEDGAELLDMSKLVRRRTTLPITVKKHPPL